ncbi:MAG TPA: Crp/Fnr family transcriptional regulator [Rhizomicrobium sp.]|nr:Crp/Fnr family transcriptional regulator [Rhizomicrobium sp.]
MSPVPSTNHVLGSLSASDLALLQPGLERVELNFRQELEQPNHVLEFSYFPDDGIVSVIADDGTGRSVEVGIVGNDSFTAQAVTMGTDRSPNLSLVQVAGHARRIRAENLRQAISHSRTLHVTLLASVQAFMVQTSFTALANGKARIDERMARWLLMAHDRLLGDTLSLTHEVLANTLGVRRAGVTVGLQKLESAGLISTKRKAIEIRDRRGLEQLAGEVYSVQTREQRRLTGWKPTK